LKYIFKQVFTSTFYQFKIITFFVTPNLWTVANMEGAAQWLSGLDCRLTAQTIQIHA